MKIKKINAKTIKDSRGKLTVEAEIITEMGKFSASIPSGTSTGAFEAISLDADSAVKNIKLIIAPKIEGNDWKNQKEMDEFLNRLDATANKSKLGANAILAVSIAVCRAFAVAEKLPLYSFISKIFKSDCKVQIKDYRPSHPCFLLVEAGKHGKGLSIQEFMVVFQNETFKNNFDFGKRIYKVLGRVLERKFKKGKTEIGLEGAYTGIFKDTEQVLDLLAEAVEGAGEKNKVGIYLDCAASEFYSNGKYEVDGKKMDGKELIEFYKKLFLKYPIIMIEDPFSQDDWKSWKNFRGQILKNSFNDKVLIIADDLTASNPGRIKKAKKESACNALILKPNQIGTVSEVLEAGALAKKFGWKIIVSHRSGETKDDFIADLAVGIGADFIKSGAPGPAERMVKYNKLLAIEKEISQ